jgi:hypothetical protein
LDHTVCALNSILLKEVHFMLTFNSGQHISLRNLAQYCTSDRTKLYAAKASRIHLHTALRGGGGGDPGIDVSKRVSPVNSVSSPLHPPGFTQHLAESGLC